MKKMIKRLDTNMLKCNVTVCRDVAQPGRALRSGRRGRWFKSSRPDHDFNKLRLLELPGDRFLLPMLTRLLTLASPRVTVTSLSYPL